MTIEELILALQGSKGTTPEAYHNAAQHLLRIAGISHNYIQKAANLIWVPSEGSQKSINSRPKVLEHSWNKDALRAHVVKAATLFVTHCCPDLPMRHLSAMLSAPLASQRDVGS